MINNISQMDFDVVVVGAGCSGISAALGAAKNGARVALIESGVAAGGELLTGMTIDGAVNARGEQVNGGVINDLMQRCKSMDGLIGILSDFRLINYICYDPTIMQIAIAQALIEAQVSVFFQTFAENVVVEDGKLIGLIVRNRSGTQFFRAPYFADCSGDAVLCRMAGSPYNYPGEEGACQSVSIMVRMAGVNNESLLEFVRANPQNLAVGECDTMRQGRTDGELAQAIYDQGYPCVFFKAEGPLLGNGIKSGEIFPTALIMIEPVSVAKKEVCVNSTRISRVPALNESKLSNAYLELLIQAEILAKFLNNWVPGFEKAVISGVSPKIGIREGVRIIGEDTLDDESVKNGRKHPECIAKGCHHIDLHEEGTEQVRIPVADGGSYDIPYGSLIPKALSNVLVAGRAFSSERGANGSARVMGGCMAMGQAAGTALALSCKESPPSNVRDISLIQLKNKLKEQGAILDGVH